MTVLTDRRVAPFGHLGITACVPLPRASRSLPRPSSPPCAQASPTCLPSLDYKSHQAELRAFAIAIYLYQSSSRPRADTSARVHNEHGKDSISHESVIDQKTEADDPSSCPSLFKQRPRLHHSRGEPRIVNGRCGCCKCRHSRRLSFAHHTTLHRTQ